MNNFISNYTTGNIDLQQRLDALNMSIADVHRRLGLTCDESIFNFQYTQDNMFTDLPDDFDEPILLYYENDSYNLGDQVGWKWDKYTRILQNSGLGRGNGRYGQKTFSSTNINGSKQLVQRGTNMIQGNMINPFNSTNLLSATGDTTTLAVDNNVFQSVGGSVSFTIDPTQGFGYAGILTSGFGSMSVEQVTRQNNVYKVWSCLQSTAISSIQLILTSSPGNYCIFTATTADDNTPFELQTWFKTQYSWDLVSIAGSPNFNQITSYEVRYNEGTGFGNVAIPYFRINNLYSCFPDSMNLVYYSQYKGTDVTGASPKIILDQLTDLPNFMQFYPDFQNPIALRAAYILMPQLSGDKDFMAMYKSDFEDYIKDLGFIYPRKRCVNLGSTILRRP
jgi:hypothetical protein